MKKRSLFLATMILISITMNSCGVMFGGSKYNATIVAKNHPNADIYVNGEKAGKGSVNASYYRNRPLEVKLKHEDCEEHKKTYHSVFRTGSFMLSAFSWGLLGMFIDLGTGAAHKPDHNGESSVIKKNDKDYTFNVEYPECSHQSGI
ncbi:hypothetical protein [Aquimarina pacifica]|uniref:hypothetical protein n=1 Tax=Aquimarina pacifica TaxID=1296415 RepID=UPI000472C1F1|nr:hypothetical protein [Aquimarina pacifica]